MVPLQPGVVGRCMAFGLAVTLAGCGRDPAVTLPSPSTPIAAPSPSARTPSPQAAVRAAYTAFWAASNQALAAPPEQVRSILQDYSTGSYLDFQIRTVILQQAEHKGPWGKVVLHIRSVRVDGTKAAVRDCQDASHAGLADTRTHRLIPGTRGHQGRNLVAQLTRGGDGRWRVSDLKQSPQSC